MGTLLCSQSLVDIDWYFILRDIDWHSTMFTITGRYRMVIHTER